ncbi:hypothetical protein MMC12_001748 [Toensbergia leucococca]|nr:hypothetical protein [Toensbergia leucococca]
MTKIKPDPKSKAKQSVSTSRIFKKAEAHGEIGHQLQQKNATATGSLFRKSNKYSKPVKRHTKGPEHPLALAFSENIEQSREHIQQNATTSLDSIHENITERLNEARDRSQALAQAAAKTHDELVRPIDQEQLQFTSRDGRPAGTAILGHRIKRFKKIIAAEEKELASLWTQWTEVQQEITNFASETLGSGTLETLAKNSATMIQRYTSEEQKKATEELEAEGERLRDEIAGVSKASLDQMKASEEEMIIREKQARKKVLELWGAEM